VSYISQSHQHQSPEPKKVKAKTRPKIKVDTTPGKNRPSRKVITPFVIKKAKKK
jgi:hypothetical protein